MRPKPSDLAALKQCQSHFSLKNIPAKTMPHDKQGDEGGFIAESLKIITFCNFGPAFAANCKGSR
jgi:hypothetical protein